MAAGKKTARAPAPGLSNSWDSRVIEPWEKRKARRAAEKAKAQLSATSPSTLKA